MYRDLLHRTSCCVCLPYRRTRSIESKWHPVYRSVADTHDAICERVLSAPLPPAGSVAPKPAATTATAAPSPSCGESTNGIAGSEERTNHGRCLALRDFYPFWRKNLESPEAGKVLPVDLSDSPKVKCRCPKLPGCRCLSSLWHSRACSGDCGVYFLRFRAAWLLLWPVAVVLDLMGRFKRSKFCFLIHYIVLRLSTARKGRRFVSGDNVALDNSPRVPPWPISLVPWKVWPVMFDDNIGHWRPDGSGSGAHIVDVRDMVTGRPVPFDTALERHIVRAEPFLAIDQDDVAVGAAAADASDHNFFLVHILKRLAPERAGLYTSACDGFSSK